jgi:hypothetical protein
MKRVIQILMLSLIMVIGLRGNVYAVHLNASSWTSTTTYDAQATINTPFYPITYFPSWSCNYTMITDGTPNQRYAQVGWSKDDDLYGRTLNGTYYFFQYNNSMATPYNIFSTVGPAVGSNHTYITMLDGSTYYGTVDGSTIGSHNAGFTGNYAQYSGEVSDEGSARFAGSSTNKLFMFNIYSAYMNNGTKIWTLSPPLDFVNDSKQGFLYEGSWVVGSPNASFSYYDKRN